MCSSPAGGPLFFLVEISRRRRVEVEIAVRLNKSHGVTVLPSPLKSIWSQLELSPLSLAIAQRELPPESSPLCVSSFQFFFPSPVLPSEHWNASPWIQLEWPTQISNLLLGQLPRNLQRVILQPHRKVRPAHLVPCSPTLVSMGTFLCYLSWLPCRHFLPMEKCFSIARANFS